MILLMENSPLYSFRVSQSEEERQRKLARFNEKRFKPSVVKDEWESEIDSEFELRMLEGRFLEKERNAVASLVEDVPTRASDFVAWFEELKRTGSGQNDPLFDWLAHEAQMPEMKWFLTQEVGGEAGFDDLVALTQIKFPPQAKLELARNYWDEMGRGNLSGMHGLMLSNTVDALDLTPSMEETVWESLALSNLMAGLASNRRYAYHSVGALGAIELTAPTRVEKINQGLKRLDVPTKARQYFALHAQLDIKHSECWNKEVLWPLVTADPKLAKPIAEGALMRLRAGQRCFIRYRDELGI